MQGIAAPASNVHSNSASIVRVDLLTDPLVHLVQCGTQIWKAPVTLLHINFQYADVEFRTKTNHFKAYTTLAIIKTLSHLEQ